jgi:ABC-type transporter Mla maintaining outer membrane lipid asymmetry ATPase subunit MlaF
MLYNHRIEWTGAVDEARTTDNPIVKAFIQGSIGD